MANKFTISIALICAGVLASPSYSQTTPESVSAQLDGIARRTVTVAELGEMIDKVKGERDGNAAKKIKHLQLSERLSSPELAKLIGGLPGAKSKAALMAVGDASVFLEPPKSEMLDTVTPNITEQQQIISRAVEYVRKIVPELPNFYAKRFTTSFSEVWTPKHKDAYGPEVLHPAGKSRARVLYRNGKEVVRAERGKEPGLITQGVFGPILSTVISDTMRSPMEWCRWEKPPDGPMAVFRFDVARTMSDYRVSFAESAKPLLGEAAKLTLGAPAGAPGHEPGNGSKFSRFAPTRLEPGHECLPAGKD